MVAYNPHFYADQFKKNDSANRTGISEEDLQRLAEGWIAYLSGRSDTLQNDVSFDGGLPRPFYSEDELSHMKDAKVVFLAVRTLGWILLPVGAVTMLALILTRSDRKRIFSFGAIWGSASILILGALIGIIIALNFQAAFTVFHNIFFPQGNWQFPASSAMIQLLPGGLFMDAAVYILIKGIAFSVSLLACGFLVKLIRERSKEAQNYTSSVSG